MMLLKTLSSKMIYMATITHISGLCKKIRRQFILAAFLWICAPAYLLASTDPEVTYTFPSLVVNSTATLQDPVFYDNVKKLWIENVANDKYDNTIALFVNEETTAFLQSDFTCKVTVEISYVDLQENAVAAFTKDLIVSYKRGSGTKYHARQYYYFKNARQVTVKILAVDTYGATWDILPYVKLENRMIAHRDYNFNCQVPVTYDNRLATADALKVQWLHSSEYGATHYDIEWAWIADEGLDKYKTVISGNLVPDARLIFRRNATRVTINKTNLEYIIPMLYDGEGRLYYRIRPVQYRENGDLVNGTWSSVDVVSADYYYEFSGHENNQLNWQVSTSFAEEGKLKSVIQYFDGTLRKRQMVTKDNSTEDKNTVVAETYYDYQGRPAINILPAPTLNTVMSYARNFNKFTGTAAHPKDFYDLVAPGGTICSSPTPQLDNNYGTSKYYSANNPLQNGSRKSFDKFIPDANGYPYTETRYLNDASGRIAEQSGVGPDHQLRTGDNAHQTKYFYSTPDQRELDALFGLEAGYASHYSKNIVQDANGQLSVSYVDMQGRTVATALAGKKPARLDALPSYNENRTAFAKDLITEENNLVKDRSVISSTSFVVTSAGNHEFKYKVSPYSLEIRACNPNGTTEDVCYECYYELEIVITDQCGAVLKNFTSKPFNFGTNAEGEDIFSPTCRNPVPADYQHNFTLNLPIGEYNVTKTLRVSKAAQDWYRTTVFTAKNICKTVLQFKNEILTVLLANSDCGTMTCASCTTAVGIDFAAYKTKYLAAQGLPSNFSLNERELAELSASYTQALASCEILCNSTETDLDIIREQMLQDMTPPFGQYATEADPEIPWNPMFSVLYKAFPRLRYWPGIFSGEVNITPSVYTTATVPYYKSPLSPLVFPPYAGNQYSNNAGIKDPGAYDPSTGAVLPVTGDFVNRFSDNWAYSLLRYHPEYTKLQISQVFLKPSYDWDAELQKIEKWDEAVSKGFINNGTAMNNAASSITMNDPFFTPGTGYGSNLKSKMDGYINSNYIQVRRTGSWGLYQYMNVSIWKYAYSSIACQNPNDATCLQNSPSFPTISSQDRFLARCSADRDLMWQTFKALYLTAKNDLIAARLKNDPYDYVLYPNLKAFKHMRRFGSQAEMAGQASDMPDKDDPQVLQKQYRDNCEAYKEYWRQELEKCPQYISLNASVKLTIEKHLADICVGGSDETHPMGSSSTAPGVSLIYKRFEDMLQAIFNSNGIAITSFCHPFMIDYPRPYEEQVPVSDEVLTDMKDDCLCNKLTDIKQQMSIFRNASNQLVYPVSPASALPGNMRLYLQNEWGYTVSEQLLATLIDGCNPKQNCVSYYPPITVPGFLMDCKPLADNCINCSEYHKFKAEFIARFPSAFDNVIFANPASEEEERLNIVFEEFMNIKTGLNLRWQQYLNFERSCPSAPPTINCGELRTMELQFRAMYTNSSGIFTPPSDCQAAFVAKFNSYFQTSYTTWLQVMNIYRSPDVNCTPPKAICSQVFGRGDIQKISTAFYTTYGSDYYNQPGWDTSFVNFFNSWTGTNYDSAAIQSLIGAVAGDDFIAAGKYSYAHLFKLDSAFVANNGSVPNDSLFLKYAEYFNDELSNNVEWDSVLSLYQKNGLELKLKTLPISKEKLVQLNEQFKTSGRRLCSILSELVLPTNSCYTAFISNAVGQTYNIDQLVSFHNIYFLPLDHLDDYFQPDSLISFYAAFAHNYKDSLNTDSCQSVFTQVFNNYYQSDLEYATIEKLYREITKISLPLCSSIPIVSAVQINDVYNDFIAMYPFPQGYFNGGDREKFREYFNARFSSDYPTLDTIRNFYYVLADSMPARYQHLVSTGMEDDTTALNAFKTMFRQKYQSFAMPKALTEHLFTTQFNINFRPAQYHNFRDIVAIYYNDSIELNIYAADSTGGFACNKLNGVKLAYRALYYSEASVLDTSGFSIDSGIDFTKEVELSENLQEQSRFTAFANLYLRTNFATFKHLVDSSFTACGSMYAPVNIYSVKSYPLSTDPDSYHCKSCQPLLCGKREPRTITLPPKETCEEELEDIAWVKATEQFNAYLLIQHNSFDKAYLERCLDARHSETFTVKAVAANAGEYHYTLYYYDQAGNLVKTVPPEGVHPVSDESYFTALKNYRKNGGTAPQPPVHTMLTEYRYNSLNQVVTQKTPDAGESKFWYDRLGRLVISQNAQQAVGNLYSYTLYDELGRIKEAGEKPQATAMTQATSRQKTQLESWLSVGVNKQQITRTTYDFEAANVNPTAFQQHNLRNRVSYVQLFETDPGNDVSNQHNHATYYNYDIHGNVEKLMQDYGSSVYHPNALNQSGNRFKLIEYGYDLISGKVNTVSYQAGMIDGYYHKYEYDAENRLTKVYTSRDRLYWEREAYYQYYLHGPLARTILGNQQVQGVDYAYTLQGWLKGVNSTGVSGMGEPGTCQPGTGKTSMEISDRKLFGQPGTYTASQSIMLLPGFNNAEGDEFTADIDPSLIPCQPGEETNIPYMNGDMGEDGKPLGINPLTGRDAYGFGIHYYQNETAQYRDYKAINSSYVPFANGSMASSPDVQLFNGNIGGMSVNIPVLKTAMLTHYRYDQLNRLVKTYNYKGLTENNAWQRVAIDQYEEQISYDANGNIITYNRNGNKENTNLLMDGLTYQYPKDVNGNKINNRLRYVHDVVPANRYTTDIDNQTTLLLSAVNAEKSVELPTDNYRYDKIGNLIYDKSENINSISWNVYGKIQRIQKTGSDISYGYDASGNRVSKIITGEGAGQTWYVRDATGNVMAVYQIGQVINSNNLTQTEVHFYGNNRLGVINSSVNVNNLQVSGALPDEGMATFMRGIKVFELSNHLGNVLVTVSDRKIAVPKASPNQGTVDYYTADVINANDYYPFGMMMPGRSYNAGNEYRYGFNGKEKIAELSNVVDFTARLYNPATGRWFSTDPHDKAFSSPYNFTQNNPINRIDPDGKDDIHFYEVTSYKPMSIACSTGVKTIMMPVVTHLSVVIKSNGPDNFYHHKLNEKTGKDVITQFYPDLPGKKTGLTRSWGGITKDDDRTTLIKFIDIYGLSKNAVDASGGASGYTEIGPPGSPESVRMKKSDWWVKVFQEKGYREKMDAEDELRATVVLTALSFIGPELILARFEGGMWLGGLSRLGKDPATLKSAANLIPKKGWYDVVVHGDRAYHGMAFNINGVTKSVSEVYEIMLANGYKQGTPIRLISCNSGKAAAQDLANLANAKVIAPVARTKVVAGGKIITENGSKYQVFKPNP